jgi:predicted MPP superfamily phosphohydrolase
MGQHLPLMYDGTTAPDLYKIAEPLKKLSAPFGVFYITGNHEEYGDINAFLKAIRELGITILFDEIVDVEGVQLVGVDYNNAAKAEGFKKILDSLALDTNKPTILLKHEPKDLEVAEAAGVSLQISGHTHYGQQWPFRYMAQMAYKGYAYGLKDFKKLQMLTSSGIGTWGPPIRIGTVGEAVVITFK